MLFEEGTVALVTGAARGIGRAIAIDLAREGAAIVVNYHESAEAAEEVAETIRGAGGTAVTRQADVSNVDAVRRLFRAVRDRFDRLDVVVNNAGITDDALLPMMDETTFDRVLKVSLYGTYACSREALRLMARQRRGAIVNVASVAGLVGNAGQTNYAAAKGGVIAFTKALSREAAPLNIRVNAVAPGLVDTDITRRLPAEAVDAYLGAVPMQRIGRPEEVAAAVSFLASDRASYITGKVLAVDGGLTPG